jgi:hypothetical protein
MIAMLQVDLQESDQQISRFIAHQCVQFGNVVSVNVVHSPASFAVVQMANELQTFEVAGRFGGSAFGIGAVIRLEQKRQ